MVRCAGPARDMTWSSAATQPAWDCGHLARMDDRGPSAGCALKVRLPGTSRAPLSRQVQVPLQPVQDLHRTRAPGGAPGWRQRTRGPRARCRAWRSPRRSRRWAPARHPPSRRTGRCRYRSRRCGARRFRAVRRCRTRVAACTPRRTASRCRCSCPWRFPDRDGMEYSSREHRHPGRRHDGTGARDRSERRAVHRGTGARERAPPSQEVVARRGRAQAPRAPSGRGSLAGMHSPVVRYLIRVTWYHAV